MLSILEAARSASGSGRAFWTKVIATAFGLGYAPVAPGTAGSVAGVLIHYFIYGWPWWLYLFVLYFLFFIGAWVAQRCQELLHVEDPGMVVIDEVLGMLVAVMTFPPSGKYLLAGFLLFRFFDILKPFPASLVDRKWRTGYGVMMDDIIAGVYANLCLQALRGLGWW